MHVFNHPYNFLINKFDRHFALVFLVICYNKFDIRKEFLNIQASIECRFTMKRLRNMIITYSQMHLTGKYSQHFLPLPPYISFCHFPWLHLPPHITSAKPNCPEMGKIHFFCWRKNKVITKISKCLTERG